MINSHSKSGSVLLETLLVLPLLLLLVGGLFMIGDILHGRLHLLTAERVAAWSTNSRFEVGRKDIFESWFKHLDRHTALKLERAYADWYETDESKEEDWFDIEGELGNLRSKTSTPPRGTSWLDFVGGRADGVVEVPIWAAMANTHNVMFNNGYFYDSLSCEWRLNVYDEDGDDSQSNSGEYKTYNRQYVLRRTPDTFVEEDFRRNVSMEDINWIDIAVGDWPCSRSRSGLIEMPAILINRLRRPFSRHPVAMAVGE